MKETPILMSPPMVKALVAGNKTETRRLTGLEVINESPDQFKYHGIDKNGRALFEDLIPEIIPWISPIQCPYGKIGDILWVRETFLETSIANGKPFCLYKADFDFSNYAIHWVKDQATGFEIQIKEVGWKPSIFLKKKDARIWLEITDLKVERLQTITKEGALAEGIDAHGPYYKQLWQTLHGAESWDANPWVWVVKFKILSTTGKPSQISHLTSNI